MRRAVGALLFVGVALIMAALLAIFAGSSDAAGSPAPIISRGAASSATYVSDSTTSLTLSAPTGAQPGDLLVASLGFGKTGASAQATLTAPAGWTLVSRTNQTTIGTIAVFDHVFAAGESSYKWTTNITVGGAIFMAAFGNANTLAPIDVSAGAPISTSGTSVATPSITTTQPGDELVASFFGYNSAAKATSWSTPSGMTQIGNATKGASRAASLDIAAQAAAGATGTKTSVASVSQDYAIAALTAVVAKQTQTISFTSSAPTGAVVGGTYTPTATATSGLPVTFTIDATSSGVCAISAGTVSFTGAGTCVIDANQSGSGAFLAAPQAQQSVIVASAATTPQTLSFTSTAPVGALVGGTYTPTATATSGLPVTFTIDATSSGVCAISAGTVSFTGAGTCVIDANQAGNATYAPAPQAQQSVIVSRIAQTISFTSSAPTGAVVGGTYTPTATATSGLPVTFTIDATSSGVCAISAGTVSFTGAGTCVIDANQSGSAAYAPAGGVAQSVSVTGVPVTHGVIDLWMESYGTSELLGNPQAPYINSLVTQYGYIPFTSLGHDSEPSYVLGASGIDTFTPTSPDYNPVIVNDGISTVLDGRQTIFDELAATHQPWRIYTEPGTSDYRDPTATFPHLLTLSGGAADVDFNSTMIADLNSATPPVFSFLLPSNAHNMHDTGIPAGDTFLSQLIPQIQATAWYRNGGTIVIQWDEDDAYGNDSTSAPNGGEVMAIVVSKQWQSAGPAPHTTAAGVLGSIEDAIGVARLGTSVGVPSSPLYP